jgi:hypothetical protein
MGFDYPAGPGTFGEVMFGRTSNEIGDGAQRIANSPPVGSNLGAAFAGGAAIMLFLIVVTTQAARRRPPSSPGDPAR